MRLSPGYMFGLHASWVFLVGLDPKDLRKVLTINSVGVAIP